jgi:hypothetical protein
MTLESVCECYQTQSVMIITFQSPIPASDCKRKYAAWEKHLGELGFVHPSPPSRLAKRLVARGSVSGESCDI